MKNMKARILLAVAALLYVTTANAYDYDYSGSYKTSDDGGMGFIVIFAIIVGAILNIILFFKIWGMTNNVARITKTVTSSNLYPNPWEYAAYCKLNNYSDEQLNEALTKHLTNTLFSIFCSASEYQKNDKTVLKKEIAMYKSVFVAYGFEYPAHLEHIETLQDIQRLGWRKQPQAE